MNNEHDKNIWLRIVKKSKEEVLVKIDGAIRSFSWDEFNSMFIMHPQEKNLAKLREVQKKNVVDSVDDLISRTIIFITDNNFNIDDMEDPRQALLATYITELERKLRCSRQEVRDLIKKRMNQILNQDQNFRVQANITNKQVSKNIHRQSKGKFTIGSVIKQED
jgi:hypothetical protein